MATIITVHGTGATGPEEGDRWWQRGSEFETHIRQLVESEDGELKYEPFVWNGANSEDSRRNAGRELAKRLQSCERDKEPYCVVGHSHGGSVCANALLKAATKRGHLQHLRKWVSIGTPFITFKNSPVIYTKLSTAGKAGYIAVLTATLFYGSIFLSPYHRAALSELSNYQVGLAAIFVLLPIATFYLVARMLLSGRFAYYSRKRRNRANQLYGSLWSSFCHKDDEAINALAAMRALDLNIYQRHYLVPLLSPLAILVLPAIFLLLLFGSRDLMLGAFEIVQSQHTIQVEDERFAALLGEYWAANLSVMLSFALIPTYLVPEDWAITSTIVTAIWMFGCIPLFLFLLALALAKCFAICAGVVSSAVSKRMNQITKGQLLAAAYGSDMPGERAVGSGHFPDWRRDAQPMLPDVLGDEITKISDAAAAKSMSNFRAGLNSPEFRSGLAQGLQAFSDYLTWDELIHTSYFQVPRFRKLVAYAITTAEGFRATDAFKADPDYALVAEWYEALRPDPTGNG